MKAARARDVTVDGLTRVAAVLAAMAESDQAGTPDASSATAGEGSLKDLIAKAAQAMAGHASTARALRSRGHVQQGRARESLRIAVSGQAAESPRTLDLVR